MFDRHCSLGPEICFQIPEWHPSGQQEFCRALNTLRELFQYLHNHGFVTLQNLFLGAPHYLSGAIPLPDKMEAINHFKQSITVKGLPESVGTVNFYHWFIPPAARMMSPLFQHSQASPSLPWDDTMVKAFQDTMRALARAAMMSQCANVTQCGATWGHRKGVTALSTGSCWLSTLGYNTSDISWSRDFISHTLTTSLFLHG